MTDSTLNKFIAAGTAADRVAFTPSPPTPAAGAAQGYFWHETDTGDTYSWKAGTGWIKVNSSGAVTSLSTAVSTVDSNQSSSISTNLSKITSLSTAVSTVDSNQSTSLSQVSSSLSGAISSTTSLSTALASGTDSSPMTPQGRLTLVSATPVMSSEQTAKASILYTPYVGCFVPIYSGAVWANKLFAELTLALDTTNHLLDKLYDVFIWNNGGTIAIGAGPAWNYNSTVTMTIATPAVISWTAHGLNEGDPVIFTTSGALPTGITAGTTYFVGNSPGTNSFQVSTTRANAAAGTFVATSGSQSGTHTATVGIRQRGTGAGTTELQALNGIWTNKNSITLTNGAGAGTSGIAANTATYVGTFYCTANGQTGMAFKPAAASGGSNNILGLYNAYNRVRTIAMCRDSTASWTYSSTTWRAANNNTANRISFVDGLQQSALVARREVDSQAGATTGICFGVSIDSTTSAPDIAMQNNATVPLPNTITNEFLPQLGFHYLQAMEVCTSAVSSTFFGALTVPTRQTNALTLGIEI